MTDDERVGSPQGADPLKDLDGSTRQKSYGQGGNDPHRI